MHHFDLMLSIIGEIADPGYQNSAIFCEKTPEILQTRKKSDKSQRDAKTDRNPGGGQRNRREGISLPKIAEQIRCFAQSWINF